jgi:hypothetical protein
MEPNTSKKAFKFTPRNIAKIKKLNQILDQKTRLAYSLAKQQEDNLLELMKIPGSFVSDYEIEFNLALFSKNKPEGLEEPFFEDKDVFSFYKKDGFSNIEQEDWLLNENHNEFQFGNSSLSKQTHCWLLHHLYDHTQLTWHDILGTDVIWLEVIVRIQNFTEKINKRPCNFISSKA